MASISARAQRPAPNSVCGRGRQLARTIRLGKTPQKAAEKIKRHVAALAGVDAAHHVTGLGFIRAPRSSSSPQPGPPGPGT